MKLNSIKKNEEFRVIYRKGKSIANKNLVLYYYKNNEDYNRLGISVSKKVGNAVVRNKIKRRIKESYRDYDNKIEGYDLVIIARIKSNNADYKDIDRSLKNLIRKI